MKETTPEIAAKHVELRAYRDAFVAKLTTALQAAGFTVTGTMPTGDWADGSLTIANPKLHKTASLYAKFTVKGHSRIYHNHPTKVELKWGRDTGWAHSKGVRYFKLDDALVKKLVDDAKAQIENVLQYERSSAQAKTVQERWEHRRAMELAGMTLPPGATVSVIMGSGSPDIADGPDAGKYKISFSGRGTGITGMALTREQVIKLMDLLNEIQDTPSSYVIVGTNKDGSRAVWGGFGWWSTDVSVFKTKAHAEADLPKVKAQSPDHPKNIKVQPYTEVFTIKP